MRSYGWRDFDQEVAKAISAGDPKHVLKRPDGGMTCPLVGHGEWLTWRGSTHRHGTVPHALPEAVFRVTPTYILSNKLDNFVTGHDLVRAAIDGEWGKAETYRLGHENSEDAVSFNVFRSLQEAGELKRVAGLLTGEDVEEPDLYLWGRQIHADGSSSSWPELKAHLGCVEPHHRQQTEPDVVMHIPGWGWIFIEAKLAHGIKTAPSKQKMLEWLARYPSHAPGLFDLKAISRVRHDQFPEQLLRNMVFANLIRDDDEQACVVALGRASDKAPVDRWVAACLSPMCPVGLSALRWEQIYAELPANSNELACLRTYMEDKSYALRPAFDLPRRRG